MPLFIFFGFVLSSNILDLFSTLSETTPDPSEGEEYSPPKEASPYSPHSEASYYSPPKEASS
ncbi:MAG: hypothetical protein LBC74_09820 [Planctomycetaceae bacterium]|nr:hypothetical protein [Planctomycetaceae bacterium]